MTSAASRCAEGGSKTLVDCRLAWSRQLARRGEEGFVSRAVKRAGCSKPHRQSSWVVQGAENEPSGTWQRARRMVHQGA